MAEPLIVRNQTTPDWIPTEEGDSRLGVGLFLVLDPSLDSFPPLRSVAFKGITYAQCLVLGEMAAAFKWVPPHVADSPVFENLHCVGKCKALGYCKGQPHCWCLDGKCELKPVTQSN